MKSAEYYVSKYFTAGAEIPGSAVFQGTKEQARAKAKELNAWLKKPTWFRYKARKCKA